MDRHLQTEIEMTATPLYTHVHGKSFESKMTATPLYTHVHGKSFESKVATRLCRACDLMRAIFAEPATESNPVTHRP